MSLFYRRYGQNPVLYVHDTRDACRLHELVLPMQVGVAVNG